MDRKRAEEVELKILELQSIMIAYVTDARTDEQPALYKDLYTDIYLEFESAKFPNPNSHKSLESFWGYCKLKELKTYASRRMYVKELYADVLLELKRMQKHEASSKNWKRANNILEDELSPIRTQWLKAKNFSYASTPDYENSIKESINSIESCLMVLLDLPNSTLGKIIRTAELDPDIEKLISQAYGLASNRSFVRHGGVGESGVGKAEAEFFLEFSASAIIYIVAKKGKGIKTP